uniref:Secreted protein n=1 Tax=Globodera pallida TaxID=36090 RepID=A0A183BNW7_GLOPA
MLSWSSAVQFVLVLCSIGPVFGDVRRENEVLLLIPFNARHMAKRHAFEMPTDFAGGGNRLLQLSGRTVKRGIPRLFPMPWNQQQHKINIRRTSARNWLHFG